jgi:hypothetical protein
VPVNEVDRKIVEDLCGGMQIGPAAEGSILALFADDAVFVEPFTGQVQTHVGKPAIQACLSSMWQNRAPDFRLTVDRVDMDGDTVLAEWTCTSTFMPGPMRGQDLLKTKGGKISRLEIIVTEMPKFGS